MTINEAIFKRRSVRNFKQVSVEKDIINVILKAAISGPSCVDSKDWAFIVVENKETLKKMVEANGRAATPLLKCSFAVLICGDLEKAFKNAKNYWIVDGAIAGENMILCAMGYNVGSVWLGTWPQMDRVKAQQELFNLPLSLIPHSIIAFGYPEDDNSFYENDLDESVIHYEKW